jgi:hypothetical protein
MPPGQRKQFKKDAQKKKPLKYLREAVYQNRLGHFRVECQVLDGSRVMGADVVEIEVVSKGRFSDVGLPAVPIA